MGKLCANCYRTIRLCAQARTCGAWLLGVCLSLRAVYTLFANGEMEASSQRNRQEIDADNPSPMW